MIYYIYIYIYIYSISSCDIFYMQIWNGISCWRVLIGVLFFGDGVVLWYVVVDVAEVVEKS